MKFTLDTKNNSVNVVFQIPMKEEESVNLNKIEHNQNDIMFDIMNTFAPHVIESLKRRLSACENNLKNHLNDCKAISFHEAIIFTWNRKQGRGGHYNTKTAEIMEEAISCLSKGDFKTFLSNSYMLNQTLKALLNDTEPHPNDIKNVYWSEFVSLLTECVSCAALNL